MYTVSQKTSLTLHTVGSAETLARRDGRTNYHSLAYSFSNISAKNYENWLMCVEVNDNLLPDNLTSFAVPSFIVVNSIVHVQKQ